MPPKELAELKKQLQELLDKGYIRPLHDILKERGIEVHTISNRAKKRKSLAGKLAKENASYEQLSDVTDLVGLRITTYFAEDVDRVAAVIAEEFDIDPENSVDKRQALAADRFGYLSLHQVMSLKKSRCELTEYRAFKGLKVELQTRSVLQHAWAEIEHDLGYKSEIEVPQHIRRRFALVAGLLELADREFDGVKQELKDYREKLPTAVQGNTQEIALDLDSMRAFITKSPIVQNADNAIIKAVGGDHITKHSSMISNNLEIMQQLGFKTIGEITNALKQNEHIVIAFARNWIKHGEYSSLSAGVSLFYLWYVLIGEKPKEEILQHITEGGYGVPEQTTKRLIDAMAKTRRDMPSS